MKLQSQTAMCFGVFWILVFIALNLSDSSPNLSQLPIPAHYAGSFGLAIVLSSLLVVFFNLSGAVLGWTSVMLGTVLVIALEFAQQLSHIRTFEYSDIYEGIAGLIPPTVLCVASLKLLGTRWYLFFSNLTVASMVVAFLAFTHNPKTQCDIGRLNSDQWLGTKIGSFEEHSKNAIGDSSSKSILFCRYGGTVTVANPGITFQGGGVQLPILKNFFSNINDSNSFTFGINFQATPNNKSMARVVATITDKSTNNFFFRIIQTGSTIHVSVQTEKGKREGLSFHTIEPDEKIVLVISHNAGQMNLWVADKKVGTIYSSLDNVTSDNPDAIINLGWRTDRRLNPFLGKVSSIFLSTQPLDEIAVTRIFRQLN